MAVIPDTHNTGLTPTQIDTAFSNALTHTPSDSTPKEDGSGSAGEAETFARSDHEHPHDTTKQDTLAFEGTYNASTNKVATMSAVKDGKLAGYAQTSGNVAETDKIIEAIGKVEKKADDNKSNILTLADSGGKRNLIPVTRDLIKSYNPTLNWNGYTAVSHGGLDFTINEDLSVTISGTCTNTTPEFNLVPRLQNIGFLSNGDYVVSGDYTSPTEMLIGVNRTVDGSGVRYATFTGTPVEFTVNDSPTGVGVWIGINALGKTLVFNNIVVKPMICTKAQWDISHSYAPYTITLAELYQKLKEANVI